MARTMTAPSSDVEPPLELVAIGLGNTCQRFAGSSGTLVEHAGVHASATHNLGWAAVRKLGDQLGAPAFELAPETLRQGVRSKWATELWVAVSRAQLESGVSLLLVLPGPGINAANDALLPWLEARGDRPSRVLLVCDDAALPPGALELSLDGPLRHRGLDPIRQRALQMLPVLRIGCEVPPDGDWSRGSSELNAALVDRAANALLERARLAASRGFWPVSCERSNAVQPERTLARWVNLERREVSRLRRLLSERRSGLVAPVYLTPNLTRRLRDAARRLAGLSHALLTAYRGENPTVIRLLEETAGPLPPHARAWYRHRAPGERARDISTGPDHCWDFFVDHAGRIKLIEGDRNGGGRRESLRAAAAMRGGAEFDSTWLDEQLSRFRACATRAYRRACARLDIEPSERPRLVALNLDNEPPASCFARDISAGVGLTTNSAALQLRGGRLFVRTAQGFHPVDMLWPLVSLCALPSRELEPIVDAIISGRLRVPVYNHPVRDLVYLNKPLWAVLANDEQLCSALLDFDALLPQTLPRGLRERLAASWRAHPLRARLRADDIPSELHETIERSQRWATESRDLLRRARAVADLLPSQTPLTAANVDRVTDWIGSAFFKAWSLERWGGRGVAGPREPQRARQILEAIRAGSCCGVMMAPLTNPLRHPLYPKRAVEIRVWEPSQGERAPEPQFYVRMRSITRDKVSITSEGGWTIGLAPPSRSKR